MVVVLFVVVVVGLLVVVLRVVVVVGLVVVVLLVVVVDVVVVGKDGEGFDVGFGVVEESSGTKSALKKLWFDYQTCW